MPKKIEVRWMDGWVGGWVVGWVCVLLHLQLKCLYTLGIPASCPIIWEGGDPFEYQTGWKFPAYTVYAKLGYFSDGAF